MTEFANLKNHEPNDPLIMARTIYETIRTAEACFYGHWDLLWGKGNEGTLLVVDNPFTGIDTDVSWGFVRTQSFHWFRHFSRFIRPGMQRMETKDKSASLNGVLELVFVSKVYDASSTAILINTTSNWLQVQFGWLPNEVPGKPRKVYYSTLTEEFTYAGTFPESTKINLKPVGTPSFATLSWKERIARSFFTTLNSTMLTVFVLTIPISRLLNFVGEHHYPALWRLLMAQGSCSQRPRSTDHSVEPHATKVQ